MTERVAAASGRGATTDRVSAPLGRRLCDVVENRQAGGYRIFSVLDPVGPEPRAGQFFMLTAVDGWGQREGRPYLPRAFSVAEAQPAKGGQRLYFLVEAVGPGTERLADLRRDDGLWVTGPLGRFTRVRGLLGPLVLSACLQPVTSSRLMAARTNAVEILMPTSSFFQLAPRGRAL